MILGIDEVGRGPWAGPLVVGAVVLGDKPIEGLTDSKKLTKKRRKELAEAIYDHAQAVGLGWVSAQELDDIGMSAALKLATRRAVERINVPYHEIIIDGTINLLSGTKKAPYVTTLAKADLLIPSVSAASIVAKVARDDYMEQQAKKYPAYGFERNSGYGVKMHREAIELHGVTPLHRLSFAPLAKYRKGQSSSSTSGKQQKTTRSIGDESEQQAVNELVRQGYRIEATNWRTKYCEIDIVCTKGGVLYFVEVKHRRNSNFGGGLDAITARKHQQMSFAARFYAHVNNSDDTPLRLMAIATAGNSPQVVQVLEIE